MRTVPGVPVGEAGAGASEFQDQGAVSGKGDCAVRDRQIISLTVIKQDFLYGCRQREGARLFSIVGENQDGLAGGTAQIGDDAGSVLKTGLEGTVNQSLAVLWVFAQGDQLFIIAEDR